MFALRLVNLKYKSLHIFSIYSFLAILLIHSFRIFSYPYLKPANPPATAPVVSVSLPKLTALRERRI